MSRLNNIQNTLHTIAKKSDLNCNYAAVIIDRKQITYGFNYSTNHYGNLCECLLCS